MSDAFKWIKKGVIPAPGSSHTAPLCDVTPHLLWW